MENGGTSGSPAFLDYDDKKLTCDYIFDGLFIITTGTGLAMECYCG